MITYAYLEQLATHAHKALKIYPNSASVYQHLGNIHTLQREFEKASNYYLKAVKLASAPQACCNLLRFSLQVMSRWGGCSDSSLLEDGVLTLQEIARKNPSIHIPNVVLGELFSQQGKIEDAIACYQFASYQQTSKAYPQLVNSSWNSSYSRKPDFLIVGFPKCGTTSLYGYLASHPQILPAVTKEIRYRSFSQKRTIETYLAHFPRIQDANYLTFEASPSSSSSPAFLRDISKNFPAVKLILLLRNPVSRSISSFYHRRRLLKSCSAKSFEKAADSLLSSSWKRSELESVITQYLRSSLFSKNSTSEAFNWNKKIWDLNSKFFQNGQIQYGESSLLSAISSSLYVYALKEWLHYFSKEQVLIIKSEDLYQNPQKTLLSVCKFLNLPEHTLPEYQNLNPGNYAPISNDCRHRLADLFRPYNQELEKLLDRKFNWD